MRMSRTSPRVLEMFQELVWLANFLEQVLDDEEGTRIVAYCRDPESDSSERVLFLHDGDGSEQTQPVGVLFKMVKWLETLPAKLPEGD